MSYARITGIGGYLPGQPISNRDLVARGVASVADVDQALCAGPGLRWALMGQHLIYHLGGGPGDLALAAPRLAPHQQGPPAGLGQDERVDFLLTPEVPGFGETAPLGQGCPLPVPQVQKGVGGLHGRLRTEPSRV
jgi:hypothetical protein